MFEDFTGAIGGLDPLPYELAELRRIAAAAWDHTSQIVSTVANIVGSKTKPEQINPYRTLTITGVRKFDKKMDVLHKEFPQWQPPE